MKEIITDVNELAVRSDEIDTRKEGNLVRAINVELKEVIRANNLVGLSAIQIGYDKRLFCINFNGDVRCFVNPIITQRKGFQLARETTESLPGKTYIRPRNNDIKVMYQTPLGKTESRELVGLAAIVFQRQLDYLDGLLLCDVGLEIDSDFDEATDEEREQLISAYLDSIDVKRKQIEEEINTDKDLKQLNDAITFIENVQKGEVEFTTEA